MRRYRTWMAIRTALLIAMAIALFFAGWCLFWVLVREADGEPETERREIVVDLPGAGAPVAMTTWASEEPEDVTDIDVGHIEIYREGDGPAPEWYDPSEPMAIEWQSDSNARDALQRTNEVKCGLDAAEDDECNERKGAFLLDVPLDAELQAYIWTLCRDAGVPYVLVIAVIEAESTYRADVISASGDFGLMQINRVCHEWLRGELGVEDFLDPRDNVRAGVYILGLYYRQYGADSGTLMAYNMGQAAAESLFAAGVYETDYSRRVIGIRWRLENGGAENG